MLNVRESQAGKFGRNLSAYSPFLAASSAGCGSVGTVGGAGGFPTDGITSIRSFNPAVSGTKSKLSTSSTKFQYQIGDNAVIRVDFVAYEIVLCGEVNGGFSLSWNRF